MDPRSPFSSVPSLSRQRQPLGFQPEVQHLILPPSKRSITLPPPRTTAQICPTQQQSRCSLFCHTYSCIALPPPPPYGATLCSAPCACFRSREKCMCERGESRHTSRFPLADDRTTWSATQAKTWNTPLQSFHSYVTRTTPAQLFPLRWMGLINLLPGKPSPLKSVMKLFKSHRPSGPCTYYPQARTLRAFFCLFSFF